MKKKRKRTLVVTLTYSVAFSIGNPSELQVSSEDPSNFRSPFASLLNGFEEDTAFQFFLVNHWGA